MNYKKIIRVLSASGLGIFLYHLDIEFIIPVLEKMSLNEVSDILNFSNSIFIIVFIIAGRAVMYILQVLKEIITNIPPKKGEIKKLGTQLGIGLLIVFTVMIVFHTNEIIDGRNIAIAFMVIFCIIIVLFIIHIISYFIPEKNPWKKRVDDMY